jgi:hypothetical protein
MVLETIEQPFAIFSSSSRFLAFMMVKPVMESFPKGSSVIPIKEFPCHPGENFPYQPVCLELTQTICPMHPFVQTLGFKSVLEIR